MELTKSQQLTRLLKESQSTVFFGGAGCSTESGIPDFRSVDGLYSLSYDHPPEEIISHHFYQQNPEEFFRFYRQRMLYPHARPGAVHRVLAQLEEMGRLDAVITQNIDGLHQLAGSRNVLELHGSVHRNHCQKCGRAYSLQELLATEGVPRCSCGGIIKPDVVLYEEALDSGVLHRSIAAIETAELLIVGGTSLAVYPAAGLLQYFHGRALVLVNLSPTPADHRADLLIQGKIGEVFSQLDLSALV